MQSTEGQRLHRLIQALPSLRKLRDATFVCALPLIERSAVFIDALVNMEIIPYLTTSNLFLYDHGFVDTLEERGIPVTRHLEVSRTEVERNWRALLNQSFRRTPVIVVDFEDDFGQCFLDLCEASCRAHSALVVGGRESTKRLKMLTTKRQMPCTAITVSEFIDDIHSDLSQARQDPLTTALGQIRRAGKKPISICAITSGRISSQHDLELARSDPSYSICPSWEAFFSRGATDDLSERSDCLVLFGEAPSSAQVKLLFDRHHEVTLIDVLGRGLIEDEIEGAGYEAVVKDGVCSVKTDGGTSCLVFGSDFIKLSERERAKQMYDAAHFGGILCGIAEIARHCVGDDKHFELRRPTGDVFGLARNVLAYDL